jgi:pleiotropic regulator 1
VPTASAPTAAATSSSASSSATASSTQLALINPIGGGTKADVSVAAKRARQNQTFRNGTVQFDAPTWHSPWKLMRVISGHLGWVRAIAFSPDNEWFVTGSADRTIKVWDVASGELKLTLTGHINTIRGLVVSDRHPYLFSCGEDRTVKCWDLNTNQVIRSYHGHLSGVYSLAMHPKLDVLVSGGRDSCARLWDMRTKREIHVLGGHADAVGAVLCQPTDPQIVTGSYDHTIRLWDIVAGRSITTLTNHKRGVRALVSHPTEFTFASAAADNIKKWQLPAGRFMQNINLAGNTASRGHNLDIVNALAINEDDVMVSGGDDGMLDFWDWRSGHCFQSMKTEVQPGSLDSEAAIYAMSFDKTGSRLFTCEADKTIKIWKEDETATEETHPIRGWDPKARRRARRH